MREILSRYHVRYYIATQYKNFNDGAGCFKAVEPYMAGPHSPDIFCETPIATFSDAHKSTIIFDLAPASSDLSASISAASH